MVILKTTLFVAALYCWWTPRNTYLSVSVVAAWKRTFSHKFIWLRVGFCSTNERKQLRHSREAIMISERGDREFCVSGTQSAIRENSTWLWTRFPEFKGADANVMCVSSIDTEMCCVRQHGKHSSFDDVLSSINRECFVKIMNSYIRIYEQQSKTKRMIAGSLRNLWFWNQIKCRHITINIIIDK